MRVYYPEYYEHFRCIAGACPDSCCQEWDVQVDGETAEKYLSLPGELGDALREKLIPSEGEYLLQITDGRCPMWRSDGLCRIQAELGEAGLCRVCREYPRLRHDYGDFAELDLELSCPEAARLILSQPDAMVCREVPGGEPGDYDAGDMQVLLDTREEALDILRRHPLPEAFALLLLYAYEAQSRLDGGEAVPFDPERELKLARQLAAPVRPGALRELYAGLDILTQRWRDALANPAGEGAWQDWLKSVARCGIRRYWLQAISDFDLVGRVKSLLAGCLLLRELGGDPVAAVQLYSKEIDNSIDNVEALLDAAYTHPALTDTHLLGILLGE